MVLGSSCTESGHGEHLPATPAKIPLVPNLTDKIIHLNRGCPEVGASADVYKCQYKDDEGLKEVAVKAFRFISPVKSRRKNMNKMNRDKIYQLIRREMGIWKRVNHPNIVPFLGITYGFGREGRASLVSLWMANGTLRAFLVDYDDYLTDVYRLQLLFDISKGLSYLHSFSLSGSTPQPIVHGDLTCNNVLLDENYTARLGDFGFASAVGNVPGALAYLKWSSWGPGAVRWAAPEHFLVGSIQRTTKSDIYSFGNLVFLVLSGKLPWSEIHQDPAVMIQLHQCHKPARPESRPIQDAHWALIEQCWASIDQRPPAEDIQSSVQSFFHAFPTPQPLCDFLSDIPQMSEASLSLVSTTSGSLLGDESGDVVCDGRNEEMQCGVAGQSLHAPPGGISACVPEPKEVGNDEGIQSNITCTNSCKNRQFSGTEDGAEYLPPASEAWTIVSAPISENLGQHSQDSLVPSKISQALGGWQHVLSKFRRPSPKVNAQDPAVEDQNFADCTYYDTE